MTESRGIAIAFRDENLEEIRYMNRQIIDCQHLARRWQLTGTVEAIAKRFQRLRALPKSNPRHLKALRIGNQIRYRIADILEYEDRIVTGKRRVLT